MNKQLKDTRIIYFYILFVLCIGVTSFMMSFGLSGNDFWWHIAAGEWIVENKSIPQFDMFSWYAMSQNLEWTAHEWLSEVTYYVVYALGNQIGIYLFCFIAGALLMYLLYTACKEYILENITYAALFFIFFACLVVIYFYARPHLFSYFLLFAELKILYDFVNGKSKKSIYFIPLIGVLWANFHGGSSNLVYILCIFFIITGLFNFQFGKVEFKKLEKNKLITLGIVTVISILSICVNPYGAHMLSYPYANMADKLMLDLISEWASPDAKQIHILIFFFLPFALGLISFLTTKKKIDAIDLLIFAFFSYMFFRSSRFIVLLVISMAFYSFKYIPAFGTLSEIKTKGEKIMSGALLAIMFCIVIYGFVNCGKTYKEGNLIKRELDKEFIDLIREESPERPYTDYNYGGDLIYSGIEVYVDGRADVYTGIPMSDFYNLTFLIRHESTEENYNPLGYAEDIIEKYNFDAFLVDKDRPLCQYLYSHPEKYEIVKENKDTVYYRVIE